MKPWIKLETSLLSDPRINRLMDDMGLGGLGLYILIRMNIECMGEGSLTQDQVWAVCKKYTRISKMMRIFYDYDLFDIREDLHVRMPAHVPAPMPAREPGHMPEPMPGRMPEHVPIGIEIEQNKEIDGDGEKPTTTATMDSIQKVRQWLLDDGNLIWREPMMMHSGYGSLLQLHWPEAVEFFIQHMLSQDKLDRMYNEHEAKRYFANFSKIGLGSGKALMEHLSALQSHDNDTLCYDNDDQSLIGDLPPKPSPTAVWSYATDSWTEVH